MKKLIVVTILLTVIACAAIGEGIARLAHVPVFQISNRNYIGWATPDDVLGWRNTSGTFPSGEAPHEMMTFVADSSRVNGTPAGVGGPVVLVIGDSYSEGYGVRDNETFAWKLQERFPRLKVMNFGTPGYGTYQTLMLLRRVVEQEHIHPAAVIYGFLPFHADRNVLTSFMLEAFRGFGGERFSPPHVELHDGKLQEFPPFVVSNWPLEEHSALVSLVHQDELRYRLAGREKYEVEATLMLLNQMKDLVAKEHSEFLVATLENRGPPNDPAIRERMLDDIRKAGMTEMDITYKGSEKDPRKLHVGGMPGAHPGTAVHQWWADKIGDWLAQLPIAK